jgi:serine/threonine protein kinase
LLGVTYLHGTGSDFDLTLVLPWIETSLYDLVNSRLSYDPISIIRDVMIGVKYLHKKNVIHRDLKGDNVMILHRRAKICDFGVARDYTTMTAGHGSDVGTQYFKAPEVHLIRGFILITLF